MKDIEIWSGAQTGADRAALDFALDNIIPCGGWCPRGRVVLDGKLDDKYPVKESDSIKYPQRTEWNVRDTDATMIFSHLSVRSAGIDLTLSLAQRYQKPRHIVDLDGDIEGEIKLAKEFILREKPSVLNIAGHSEEKVRGVYDSVYLFLNRMFDVDNNINE